MKKMKKYQKVILLVLSLVFLLGVAGVYFFQIKPLYDEQEEVERSISMQKQILAAVQKQNNEVQNMDLSDQSLQLQNQLPLKPYYEQLFYILDEAQNVSNSVISNYNITELGAVTLPLQEENIDGLLGVTFALDIVSPSYNNMIEFIDILEESDRIVSIEQITFSESEKDEVPFRLTFSAYYKEGLDGLRNNQPSIDIPNPANKQNPLQ